MNGHRRRHTGVSCCCCWLSLISPIFSLLNETCNLTCPLGHLSDGTLHYVTAAPVTRNRLEVGPRFSPQFSQHLPHLVRTGQREQPLQSDASSLVQRHQGCFTFNFYEDILHKHLYGRNIKRHSKDYTQLEIEQLKLEIRNWTVVEID